MKKAIPIISTLSLLLLTGCARYSAEPLGGFSSTEMKSTNRAESDVLVIAKRFDIEDCKRHLDRDVLDQGYQPLQLFVKNNTSNNLHFSLDRLNLVCVKPDEVAAKVHTSTLGRITSYTVGALIFWPLAIPAVVDGVMSSKANLALDTDFDSKSACDQVIRPGTYFNKLLFIPKREYRSMFDLGLLEVETGKIREVQVIVN